jgi:hypothetical protein
MGDEFRDSRIVHNRLTSAFLSRLLDLRHWNALELAERSGIARSVVSAHLCGRRPVRPHHLAAYLRVLDRHDRAAFLNRWLRDNLDHELIADVLDGTKTDSMPTLEENQRRMLDWWATAIVRDSKLAKTFSHLTAKAGFQLPSVLLWPASTIAAQFWSWLSCKASSACCLVRSLCSRVEQAAVALVALLLALCQRGEVSQTAGELAEQAGGLTDKAVATSFVATSLVTTAVVNPTDFDSHFGDASSSTRATLDIPKGKAASQTTVSRSPRRSQPRHQVGPAPWLQRTIGHEWRHFLAARNRVHCAFARLIRDSPVQQAKQKHRSQPRG